MYKISLPISIANPRFECYCESFIDKCRRSGVDRVFLCAVSWTAPECEKQRVFELLVKYVPVFKAAGFEVGVWIDSLGHGGTCGEFMNEDIGDGLTRMLSLDGRTNMGAYCPLCENLQKLAQDWISRLGLTGVELIMLDDDYRYAFRNGEIFCACDKHRALLTRELGEPFDAARMKKALSSGGPNRWRDAWLRVQGKSLNDFAALLRSALDKTAPHVRMSMCSVLSTWDVDGIDSISLARTFAGATKPYLRLIGAPYWAALRSFHEIRLGAVCEYERLQQYWCKDSGIEIFCEGDSYPRPRSQVPAVFLEGFDQVMRAAGESDGILKYMFDYVSSPEYETGYMEQHLENAPLYKILQDTFTGGQAVGVTVFEPMRTFALSHSTCEVPDDRCIPASLRFVTDNSIPVRYDTGDDAAFIFGDAGELAGNEQLRHGAVLDIASAMALTRRGYDVGLVNVTGSFVPNSEEFTIENDVTGVIGGDWYAAEISPKACVDSWQVHSEAGKPDEKCPAVYTYENAAGQRFVVYCFNAQKGFETGSKRGLFRGWCRARQIRRLLVWLSGRSLDAICDPAPDLYIITKRSGDSLNVALWNFGLDRVAKPTVRLGEDWAGISCSWGKATLDSRTVITAPLPAFACTVFTLHK